MAEVVKNYIPHLVELHNYSAAHSVSQKSYNWNTLNQKVFKKIGFTLTKKDIDDAVNCVPDTIERILKVLQTHVYQSQLFLKCRRYSNIKRRKLRSKMRWLRIRSHNTRIPSTANNRTSIKRIMGAMGWVITSSQWCNQWWAEVWWKRWGNRNKCFRIKWTLKYWLTRNKPYNNWRKPSRYWSWR